MPKVQVVGATYRYTYWSLRTDTSNTFNTYLLLSYQKVEGLENVIYCTENSLWHGDILVRVRIKGSNMHSVWVNKSVTDIRNDLHLDKFLDQNSGYSETWSNGVGTACMMKKDQFELTWDIWMTTTVRVVNRYAHAFSHWPDVF